MAIFRALATRLLLGNIICMVGQLRMAASLSTATLIGKRSWLSSAVARVLCQVYNRKIEWVFIGDKRQLRII